MADVCGAVFKEKEIVFRFYLEVSFVPRTPMLMFCLSKSMINAYIGITV